jgi:hypothetical protein
MRDRVDELLSRGRLSGAERERLLLRVLAAGAPPPWWRRRAIAWLAPAVAAAALLLFMVPRSTHDRFRARGGPGAAILLFVGCEDGQRTRCGHGQKLLFSVDGATEHGFVGAYAEPEAGAGERVWYFPAADGSSAEARGDRELQTLSKAIRIGPEQPLGRYVVHLVFSRRALSRDEVLKASGPDVLARDRSLFDITP